MSLDISGMLRKAFKEFKLSWRAILSIAFWLSILPTFLFILIVMLGIFGFILYADGNVAAGIGSIVLAVLLVALYIVTQIWYSTSLVALAKKRGTGKDAMMEGAKYLTKFILVSLLVTFFLLAIWIVLALPAIVLWYLFAMESMSWVLPTIVTVFTLMILFVVTIWISMYLILAPYNVVLGDMGVFEAVNKSYERVKGNWWWTFLFWALLSVIVVSTSVIVSVVDMMVQLSTGLLDLVIPLAGTITYLPWMFVQLILYAYISAFAIFMIKQLYDALK